MKVDFIAAINQLAEEKSIPREIIFEALEAALAAAYRKDYGKSNQTIKVTLDRESGEMKVFIIKIVAEEVVDDGIEMTLKEAKKLDKQAELGGEVKIEVTAPDDYGRIAAQTAKQVVIQRLREAERDIIFNEFKDKEGKLINGTVQQIEGANVILDLGRTNAVMFASEQPMGERYHIGQRLKIYLTSVEQTTKGPQILVSRSHPNMIKELFALEVPEINTGSVEIKNVAREAGMRAKVAVAARQEGVDPVGSCVGQRGTRVQAVLSEIGNEKIDIILWNADPKIYITNAFSPAKVFHVETNEKTKEARVYTDADQLSLAIGKGGQNVRLAAKLSGWKIDVIEATDELKKRITEEMTAEKTEIKEKEAKGKSKSEEGEAEVSPDKPEQKTESEKDQAEQKKAKKPKKAKKSTTNTKKSKKE